MNRTLLAILAVSALAASAAAQEQQVVNFVPRSAPVVQERQAQVLLDKVTSEVRARIPFETRVTKGAPYSGDAVSESVQTLSDGNRIVRREATRVYRDSEGRTRRETLGESGVTSFTISDPTTGASYVLDPANQMAFRSNVVRLSVVPRVVVDGAAAGPVGGAGAGGAVGTTRKAGGSVVVVAPGPATAEPSHVVEGAGVTQFKVASGGEPTRAETVVEDLGQQVIEGVNAKGSRTTMTIPAGAIGNELPIRVVSEEWFSPELQVLVLTKHSDPRVGETTYRLTNISRTEPDRALFDLPAGYTVREPGVRK
jgi:hypothetical protein